MTFNDITKDVAFYTSTSRFVAWLGTFPKYPHPSFMPQDECLQGLVLYVCPHTHATMYFSPGLDLLAPWDDEDDEDSIFLC